MIAFVFVHAIASITIGDKFIPNTGQGNIAFCLSTWKRGGDMVFNGICF
jgi:hypothetical protein